MLAGPSMGEGKWSALALLRAWGIDFEVDGFMNAHGVSPDKAWRRGELSPSAKTPEHSGFSMVVADCSSPQELEADIASFLSARSGLLEGLKKAGVRMELDIGLMVYPMVPKGFSLSPGLLGSLGNTGTTLSITGYPCSDGEEQ